MKKNIWLFVIRPIMIVIEFPIILIGTIFLMITQFFCRIQNYLNKLNIKIHSFFESPRNSVVHVFGKEYQIWTRINDKLLTAKEANKLAKEYKNNGYEVIIS